MKSLSELFTNDYSGAGLKAIKEELFGMQQEIKTTMDKGLSKEEMAIASAYRETIQNIEECIDDVHAKINK